MNLGQAHVIQGDARALPLADNTVDLVVTSPPYFALRSYQDGGVHYDGQIGSEPTPTEFLDALLDVTRECMRVLKPCGSLWVNLGDKYVADNRGSGVDTKRGDAKHAPRGPLGFTTGGMRQKSLMGIPWRYAIRCIDELGLILRAEVIWSKPNGLPESVTDRVRRSHEQWFHFTLEPRYFSAVDEIREEHAGEFLSSGVRNPRHRYIDGKMPSHAAGLLGPSSPERKDGGTLVGAARNPLGKLPGSVWTIPTEPLKVPDRLGVDHFAAFPTEWPRRIIQGWSPAGVCVECGEGRRPVADVMLQGGIPFAGRDYRRLANGPSGGPERPMPGGRNEVTITGYACACSNIVVSHAEEPDHPVYLRELPPTIPSVVLDPFGGTGTTAMVAKALGRTGISVDMSADYCRLAKWRTNDRNQLAKVLRIDKTPEPDLEQLDLFGGAL